MGYGGPHAYFATKKSTSVLCQEESLVYHKMLTEIAYVWHYKHVNNIKREKQRLTFVACSGFTICNEECLLFITDQKD
jgi:hypothetical protein